MKWQYKDDKPYGKLSWLVVQLPRPNLTQALDSTVSAVTIPLFFCRVIILLCYCVEVRAAESAKIREKHPDRVPVSNSRLTVLCVES